MEQPGIGAVIGAALLIAGGCVGIGMLALPMVTGLAGFIPSAILFFLIAILMIASALVLAEIDCAFGKGANLITITRSTLGVGGSSFTWAFYLFLFSSLMVAYVAKGGEITNQIIFLWLGCSPPSIVGALLLVALLFVTIYEGRWIADAINRFLMAAFFLSYIYLISKIVPDFASSNLLHRDRSNYAYTIPFLITAFGFHNLVPSICDYLKRDRRAIISSIIGGGSLALLIYLVWIFAILGAVPVEGDSGISQALSSGLVSTELLARIGKSRFIQQASIYMSIFAIVTSALAQGMGLVDFLIDGFQAPRTHRSRFVFALLVLLPALLLAQQYPSVFFLGLELAGGIAAVCLFGILPVILGWKHRYSILTIRQRFLPGGKPALLFLGFLFVCVLGYEIARQTASLQ